MVWPFKEIAGMDYYLAAKVQRGREMAKGGEGSTWWLEISS